MKNQYFGDINDYRKYGLLRCFEAVGLSLGVCWMLCPDDGGSDGQKTRYVLQPSRWRRHDPALFDFLAERLTNRHRAVSELESSNLLIHARYHARLVPDALRLRPGYMSSALRALSPADLLFLDPDNGIEVKSVPFGTRGSSKYVYWREVEQTWKTGSSLLVFQHYRREARRPMFERLLRALASCTCAPLIGAIHTPHVLFLLAGQSRHKDGLESGVRLINERWHGQASGFLEDTA